MKAPRVTLRSNSHSVPSRREFELHWSGVVEDADDVVGGRCGVGGDLAEPPEMIAGRAPGVSADGNDGAAEATRAISVHGEAAAWI